MVQEQPTSQGMVIPGLVVVVVQGRTLVGKVKGATPTAGMSFQLHDALEVLGGVMPMQDGRLKTEVIPAPLHPFQGPMTLNVKPDIIVDASEDQYLGKMFGAVTGHKGLYIPGGP